MSNLIAFPGTSPESKQAHIEATSDGVKITCADAAGCQSVQVIGYDDAVNRLDAGEYDNSSTGFDVHLAVADAGNIGWFDFTAQHNLTMWRWLIAAVFVIEMKMENGTRAITEEDGSTSQVAIYVNAKAAIPVYPLAERLAMANNIEGALIGRYGSEQGTENAIVFYQSMLDVSAGELTPAGREIMATLHDDFISDLEENGIPEAPVAH